MHQLVGHSGTCRRLDCWRVHVANKLLTYTDLNAFAQSKPTLNDLKAIADEMVHVYVATHRLQRQRQQPSKERDVQFENSQLLHKYFLLYKELSHAMNSGDIGRVDIERWWSAQGRSSPEGREKEICRVTSVVWQATIY